MKFAFRTLLVAAALAVPTALGLSLATEAGAASSGKDMRELFSKLDANGDGKVTRGEVYDHRKARFAEIDTDGDGVASADEIAADMQEFIRKRVALKLSRLDTDGNGSVDAEEFARGGGHLLHHADRDGDGVVDKDEARAAAKHRRHHGRDDADRRGPAGHR